MPFDITSTMRNLQSYFVASGYFPGGVLIGEPKQPPTPKGSNQFAASLFMRSVRVNQLMLDGATEETHVVTARIYNTMLAEPTEDMELALARVVQQVVSDILADADLGGTIRNIDPGGMGGTAMTAEFGHIDQSGVMYRIADITIPMIVDGSATAAA